MSVTCNSQKKLIKEEHVTRSVPNIIKISSYEPINLNTIDNNNIKNNKVTPSPNMNKLKNS
jgi:hypothetical protein